LRLAAIVESSDDAIVSKDLNGIVQSWNPAAERIFGYTADEMVGQSILKIIPEERQHEETEFLSRIRAGKRVDHFETVRRHKDGHLLDISLTISPIRDRNGRVIGASKIARDVTERRRAEVAALRLAAIVDSSDDAIVSKDLNGIVRSWNPAAERIFGYTSDDMIGQSILKIIPRDRHHEETEVLSRIRRGERIDHFETVRQRKDGVLIDISLTVSPILDEEGRVIGVSKIARDITERRRAEAALADRNKLIDSLAENMSVGLIMIDVEGSIEFMNPAGEVITGYSLDKVRGHSLHETVHHHRPDGSVYPAEDCVIVHATAMSEALVDHQDVFIRPDGSFYNILCNVAPVVRDGRRLGTLVDLRDITEWKRADTLKDQFLGLISHELRTPLATIYGSSRLLRDRFDRIPTSDRDELLNDLVGESERLQRIIENLLLITKLEATGLDLEPLVLPRLAASAIDGFSHRNPGREISLEAADEIPPVLGNSLYVELVLENLLSNANKYSPAGRTIEVLINPADDGADLSVLDRGIGVGDDMEGLFTPFFRSTRARGMASGTGVGLAVCRRVIEAQGGSIWARPREGGGSEFGFHLQAAPSSAG
jgi:PAS domain S-box-containing protein